ncbi:peptidoglycan-binding protein [Nitrosomonas sp. Nm166]|uniref:peptidoglycan-binding domain-containing protein n=1 Tax=Nitrosomonas sp. Nm166 TaxID=1881054 RepID=UPI0008E76738|nr:peptidoglycan-binding domain-containing protein [Nitrosomonas sp. Nm166]SFE99564.1 Putative peptidoglycan binding domain-containing protein [Nitrosomonas sp. Nm166]
MKSCKISTLVSYAILLLSVALLFGCKPIFEKKPLPGKESESKEAAPAAPAPAPAPTAPAPTAPPAPAPSTSTPAEPVTKIEELQSLESTAGTPDMASAQEVQPSPSSTKAPAQAADDGGDVVKATPAIMRKVQQALVDAGFNPGPVDGVSGAKTVAAIESFQKQNNIPTGKLDKRTLRALGVDF